jgi:hypothetical protein
MGVPPKWTLYNRTSYSHAWFGGTPMYRKPPCWLLIGVWFGLRCEQQSALRFACVPSAAFTLNARGPEGRFVFIGWLLGYVLYHIVCGFLSGHRASIAKNLTQVDYFLYILILEFIAKLSNTSDFLETQWLFCQRWQRDKTRILQQRSLNSAIRSGPRVRAAPLRRLRWSSVQPGFATVAKMYDPQTDGLTLTKWLMVVNGD